MQTNWPPTTIFDPTPQPRNWMPPNYGFGGGVNVGATDTVGSPWWGQQQTNAEQNSGGFGAQGGVISTIMSLIQQLMGMLNSLLSGQQGPGGVPGGGRPFPGMQQPPANGPQQRVLDGTFSSTGDPHLAETGTTSAGTVDNHFDSMVSHRDLLHSDDIRGGYRVSTTVGTPNAAGVTTNSSASVTTNDGQDRVTMRKDGTFSITDHGQAVSIAPGQTVTLSGGESVTENNDGSLVVAASDRRGGTISTTLRAAGGSEVDVTTQAHNIDVGGDIANGIAKPNPILTMKPMVET